VTLKQATDLHTSSLSQSLAYHYLQTGRLPDQLKIIRASYKDKCQVLCEEIERELGEHLTFHRPQGGMFLWAKFKYQKNTTDWLKKTLANGVVYVPGEFFYADNPDASTLRMSYVSVADENLRKAVARLKASLE
jgi:DNA-binding transcriptional MocR family regulator